MCGVHKASLATPALEDHVLDSCVCVYVFVCAPVFHLPLLIYCLIYMFSSSSPPHYSSLPRSPHGLSGASVSPKIFTSGSFNLLVQFFFSNLHRHLIYIVLSIFSQPWPTFLYGTPEACEGIEQPSMEAEDLIGCNRFDGVDRAVGSSVEVAPPRYASLVVYQQKHGQLPFTRLRSSSRLHIRVYGHWWQGNEGEEIDVWDTENGTQAERKRDEAKRLKSL